MAVPSKALLAVAGEAGLEVDAGSVAVAGAGLAAVVHPGAELAALARFRELEFLGAGEHRARRVGVHSPALHFAIPALAVDALAGGNSLAVVVNYAL